MCNVTPAHTEVKAYGGTTLPVVGTTLLQVRHSSCQCILDCELMNHPNVQPLLGQRVCLEMNIMSFLDNDHINQPNTVALPSTALTAQSRPQHNT